MKKTISQINSELDSLIQKQAYLRKLLKETIEENMRSAIDESADKQKNIKRIGSMMSIIKYSDIIGNPWSLQFLDWKCGGDLLIKWLERIKPEKWYSTLKKLYDDRKNQVVYLKTTTSFFGIKTTDTQPISAELVKCIIEKLE